MSVKIQKELVEYISRLELHQQEQVLDYVKNLITSDQMNHRAEVSEEAIAYGRISTFDQFNEGFENWKIQKDNNSK